MSRYPWRDTSEDIAKQMESQWETPMGAQEKADKAEANAKAYSDEKLKDHVDFGTHPAAHIVESSARRFVSDAEKTAWNNKAETTLVTQTAKGLMSPADKVKLDRSTPAPTPDTLMLRDAEGRVKAAAPVEADDVARKQETDTVQGHLDDHANNLDIHTSAAEHTKLAGIEEGAEVNQNAFAKVNDIQAADPSDAVTVKGGVGITVTTNPGARELIVTATGNATPGPHAVTHITGGTDVIPNAVTDGDSGLMSGADAAFVRRDGETKAGAQAKADAAKEAAMEYTDQQIAAITIPDASLTEKGLVQLTNAIDSTAEDKAATPKAVKLVNDAATAAQVSANSANASAAQAQSTADRKLDAAAYTAGDVLAKLKTVDGAGSGLDADMLDGIDSSGYAQASTPGLRFRINGTAVEYSTDGGTWIGVGGGVRKVTRYTKLLYPSDFIYSSDETPYGYFSAKISIPAVNVEKTSINFTGFSERRYPGTYETNKLFTLVRLYNATTVEVQSGGNDKPPDGGILIVSFEVIEYN